MKMKTVLVFKTLTLALAKADLYVMVAIYSPEFKLIFNLAIPFASVVLL